MTETKPPYLTLVDPQANHDHDEEFLPLPYYPWDERPPTAPLDHDECATAIHLALGNVPHAAAMLRVPLVRLARSIRASPRLQRIQSEHLELNLHKANGEVIAALDSPDNKRREWAATKLLQSRMAVGSPLSPAPAASIQSDASITMNQQNKTLTFRWRTAQDALTAQETDDDA